MNQNYRIAHQYMIVGRGRMNLINELPHCLLGVDPVSRAPLPVSHSQVCGGPAFATVFVTEQVVHPAS